jgi:hypothetical protein
LRAFFVDGLTLPGIAEPFGAIHHTVRSWVRDFRNIRSVDETVRWRSYLTGLRQ